MNIDSIDQLPEKYRKQAEEKLNKKSYKTEHQISEKYRKGFIIVEGDPVAKGRPRFDPRMKRAYTPTKTADKEREIRKAWTKKYGGQKLRGPLRVKVFVAFEPPRKMSLKQKKRTIEKPLFRQQRPDIDNIQKLCCDALNKIAYEDDSAIVYMIGAKIYAEKAFTYIEIEEIPDNGYAVRQYIDDVTKERKNL